MDRADGSVGELPRKALWAGRRRFHFVQDVATPHNNALLSELARVENIDLRVEYANREVPEYPLSGDLADEVRPAFIYGSRLPSVRLLATAVFRPRDRWLLVAWSNATTRGLIVWFWLSRRQFNCWIDVPPEATGHRKALRSLALRLLRGSRAEMFAVGTLGVAYLENLGFPRARVHNLPVSFSLPRAEPGVDQRQRWGIDPSRILMVTGSRLTPQKGFDILLTAIGQSGVQVRERLTTIIVGRGPEGPALVQQAQSLGLGSDEVRFVDWLPSTEFANLMSAADVIVHPARVDSYGGASILARALGKPLIASIGSGAARDIIRTSQNGWLYDPEDVDALVSAIETAVLDDAARESAASSMRSAMADGSPAAAADILLASAW